MLKYMELNDNFILQYTRYLREVLKEKPSSTLKNQLKYRQYSVMRRKEKHIQ